MADVTTAQRKMFAKMKIAMPDGSYYIRKGSVGESDLENAIKAVGRGEAAGDSGDAIRLHIMARAKAIKLTAKIPDTWNSDGSLKHDDLDDEISEFFEHFGVKGMHWGVRNASSKDEEGAESGKSSKGAAKHDELIASAKQHENLAKAHAEAARNYSKEAEEVQKKGYQSAAAKRVYGANAATQGEWAFYGKTRLSKAQGLSELNNNLRLAHNQHIRQVNHHVAKAAKLRAKAEKLKHFDVDEFFEHFGIKGMHWGSRKSGTGATSNHVSEDAAKATELKATVKKHGTSALNNDDLQKLVTRLNLESQHARLNPAEVSAGEKFMNELLGVGGNVAKQQATSYANKYTAKGIEKLIKEAAKQQGHRKRNAPLRVVSVR